MKVASEGEEEGEDEKTGVETCRQFDQKSDFASFDQSLFTNVPQVMRDTQPAMSWIPIGGAPGIGAIADARARATAGGVLVEDGRRTSDRVWTGPHK